MSELEFEPAKFAREGAVTVARLHRRIEESPERVWAALTKPDLIVQWLAPGEIELRLGGAARLNFEDSGIVIDSTVTAFEPPHLLEYSWSSPGEPERPLRFEIAPAGKESDLTLVLRVPAGEDAGRSAAGFDAHLQMLAAALAGAPMKFPFETFKTARDAYRAALAAQGGP